MNIWKLLFGEADTDQADPFPTPGISINPANGLPMLEGGVIDTEGNPFGFDGSHIEPFDQSGWGGEL